MAFDVTKIIGEFPLISQESPGLHYLDNAASAQVPQCVIEAMATHDTRSRANVKRAAHRLADQATRAFDSARMQVGRYLGISDVDEVVFTSGATAGINILAWSLGQRLKPGDEILLSILEHHSNLVPWQMLRERTGIVLRFLPVDEACRLDLTALEQHIGPRTKLVALTHGSNVSGAITDVPAIARYAHARGALLMLDGAQVAPHGPLNLPSLDVDFYVFSSHKVYGPTGVGVLWGRREYLEELPPAFGGGEMIRSVDLKRSLYGPLPHRFEAGTPPITQATGLSTALSWLMKQDLEGMQNHLRQLTDRTIAGLMSMDRSMSRIRILGPPIGERRLPLISFVLKEAHPHDICQVMNDRHGVAARGGFHCAQPLHDFMGLDGSTRVSFGAYNTTSDVDAFLRGVEDCIALLC